MAFSMFSAQPSPIAIDFGSSCVKLLQVLPGEKPALVAAARIEIPDAIRGDSGKVLAMCQEVLPTALRKGKFRGKRVVCAVPTDQTVVQHMYVAAVDPAGRDSLIKTELQMQLGCQPQNVVVRALEVGEVYRDEQTRSEVISLAMTRETVMRYVELLKQCKLEVIGVHTDVLAMVRAFDHMNERHPDLVTMFVDLGWSNTKIAITQGTRIVFGRTVRIGGRQFDQHFASVLGCDLASAREQRMAQQQAHLKAAMQGGHEEEAPVASTAALAVVDQPEDGTAPAVPLSEAELMEVITDELAMCIRYYNTGFPNVPIEQLVFHGGEARSIELCHHAARRFRLPAHQGDPMSRLVVAGHPKTPGLTLGEALPGWAVVCGLCNAPTDL